MKREKKEDAVYVVSNMCGNQRIREKSFSHDGERERDRNRKLSSLSLSLSLSLSHHAWEEEEEFPGGMGRVGKERESGYE